MGRRKSKWGGMGFIGLKFNNYFLVIPSTPYIPSIITNFQFSLLLQFKSQFHLHL